MHDPVFRFRKFAVRQDRCAMKVGTDGVLLGAWVETVPAGSILDIGTGTGLIALMLAQRINAAIDAIEIDTDACRQASHNFSVSPWAARLRVRQTSLQEYAKGGKPRYDLIVSNPPFYVDAFTASTEARNMARHANLGLSFTDLVGGVRQLLRQDGRFCLILPAREAVGFIRLASAVSLYPRRITHVKTKKAGPDKRTLIAFHGEEGEVMEDELIIRNGNSGFTDEYINLTKEYYLGLKKDPVAG